MWRAQRKNLDNAGIRRIAFALLLAGVGCSESGPATVTVEGIRFVTQPGNIGAGVAMAVVVELLSSDGARVTTATDQVTLTASGGAVLSGTTTVAAVAGLATFSAVTVTSIGQNFQLTARVGDVSSTSTTFSVTAGPATAAQSTMTVPANVVAGANASLAFVFKDALNNPLGNTSVSFTSNQAGATFTPASGTTNASGGFTTDFRASGPGAVSITVNVGGTSITFPATITVAAGASALRFVTGPANIGAGQTFSVSVEVLDNAGQRLTSATNQSTLTLSGGTLQGTATANAAAGVATFNGLAINTAAIGTVMTATSGALTVQSSAFNITAGAASVQTSLLSVVPAFSAGTPSNVSMTFRDAFNNAVANTAVTLTSTLTGVTMVPSTGTTNATGVFTSVITPSVAGTGTITATVGGTPLPINVTVLGACTVGAMTLDTPLNGTTDPASGCLLGSRVASAFRFSVPASPNATEVSLIGVGTGFFPVVGISLDPPNPSTITCGQPTTPSSTLACQWLLPSGATYRAHIAPQTAGTGGAFTLTATANGTGLTGCRDRIILGVTSTYVGQTLGSSDCQENDASGDYYTDYFFLVDPRPCTIRLQTAYPLYFRIDLLSDQTSQVLEGQTDRQFVLTTCAPGGAPIRIVSSSFSPLATGAYTLTVTFTGAAPIGTQLVLPVTRLSDVFRSTQGRRR